MNLIVEADVIAMIGSIERVINPQPSGQLVLARCGGLRVVVECAEPQGGVEFTGELGVDNFGDEWGPDGGAALGTRGLVTRLQVVEVLKRKLYRETWYPMGRRERRDIRATDDVPGRDRDNCELLVHLEIDVGDLPTFPLG